MKLDIADIDMERALHVTHLRAHVDMITLDVLTITHMGKPNHRMRLKKCYDAVQSFEVQQELS